MTQESAIRLSFLFFALACAWLVVQNTFLYYGHFGYDDLYYAKLATNLFRGEIDLTDHFSHRIVPLVMTGLFYQLFGINDFASSLPTMLLSMGIFYLIYRMFRTSPWALLLAFGFYFSHSWALFYADKITPDIYVSFFTFVGWLAYRKARFERRGDAKMLGIVAAIAFYLAFSSKGTMLLVAPIFLGYLIVDMVTCRYHFWKSTVVITVGLLAVYLVVLWVITGNPLARFVAIDASAYLNPCSYDYYGWRYLFKRLSTGFLSLIVDNRMVISLCFALILGLYLFVSNRLKDPRAKFALGTVLLCFFSINFMTISLKSYNPVCLDSRFILLFSPILAVSTVELIQAALPKDWVNRNRTILLVGAIIAFPLLTYQTFAFAQYSSSLKYDIVRKEYKQLIADQLPNTDLYGSDVFSHYGNYYQGFPDEESAGVQIREIKMLPHCDSLLGDHPVYIVNNWYMDWHSSGKENLQDSLLSVKQLRLVETTHSYENFHVRKIVCE